MNKAWLREDFFIFRITRLFRASPCFTFANPRIYWGFSSSTTDPRHFLVENFKRCGFCSLKETGTWHIHNLMLPNDIVFHRTNKTRARLFIMSHMFTVFCMCLLLHLRYFSHILTSPSKAPIFHIRFSVENGEKSSRFDNFFCFTGWVSQGDELHPWIQMFHGFSPTARPLFHRLKETSFVTSSNAWSRRTAPAWKTPFAPGPRCGCKRCGEPWMASAVPMPMP